MPRNAHPLHAPLILTALVGILAGAIITHAGPLDPPAGPVVSSFKTLSEVEPRIPVNAVNTPGDATSMFIISKPGSYYLTGNIVGLPGKHAITIAAADVTLDLSGFRLIGDAATLCGITSTQSRVTVRNGSVSTFGQLGIQLLGVSSTIDSINANGIVGDSLLVSSLGSIRNCAVLTGSARGIVAGLVNTVENCRVGNCLGAGIDVSQSIVTNCIVNGCGSGIIAGSVCTISMCSTQVNKGDGIRISTGSRVVGNTCISNGAATPDGAGIRVIGNDARIEDNNLSGNDIGIIVTSTGNIILRNTCSSNTVNNYDIAASNRYGPIVNITATGSAAATGNAAASTLASTDPWANFAY